MGFLRSRFLQAVLVLIAAFLIFRFGIQPPAPWSVITLYMTIILIAILAFVSSDADSWRSFLTPLRDTVVRPERRLLRTALMIVIPLLLGYYAYTQAAAKPQAPPELRAVHPAPPASIQFRGKELNIQGLDNPLRKDQAAFKKHVAWGFWRQEEMADPHGIFRDEGMMGGGKITDVDKALRAAEEAL